MKILSSFRGLSGLLALLASAELLRAAETPLPSDARILHGKFDNGVTWMYRQHNNPPGKMALKMHVRTGSLNEKDSQEGLAHFLEHMAFNGTEHFPPGKLVPYFESIGMQFGADLNAFTSFDQTVYMLFTPNTELDQIEKALTVLSDYAFRDLLTETEINQERGVVLEEARARKNPGERIREKLWPELFEGSRFAHRLPIGDEKIIANAKRDEFVDYYKTWYRPENITIMLAGDAPPDNIVPLIKKWFGEYKAPDSSHKPMGAEFKPFSKDRALVVTDPEVAACQVQSLNLRPGRPPIVTVEQWRTDLVESIGNWIIGRRYDERIKQGQASYRRAGAWVADFFNDAVQIGISATGEAADWDKMLQQSISEIKSASEEGFSERELSLARKELLAAAERAVRTESTRNAGALLDEMVAAVNNRTPILSAEQELDLYKKLLPTVPLSEVNETFRKNFAPGTFAYVVTMSSKEASKVPSRDQVLAKGKEAWIQKVASFKEDEGVTNILSELPKPGKVAEKTVDPDLQVTSAWLDNGVRVHHRFMDYKKDSVLLSISLAGGNLEETATNAGVTQVASLAVNEAATSKISSSKMRDLLTGVNIQIGGGAAGDHFIISVTGSPLDLETGLQEAYALLTDGRIEPAAFKNWKMGTLQQIEQREKLPTAKAQEAMEDLLSGGDPRRIPLKKAQVEALTIDVGQAWFNRLCREAPIEVAIVGDISLDKAMPLIERYLGSLSKRKRTVDYLNPIRKSFRQPGPLERHVVVDTVTPQAMALVGFAAAEGKNTADSRSLELASLVLSSRLVKHIREELSIVYSIYASNVPSWIYTDVGRFYSGAPCDPQNVDRVSSEIDKIFQQFAESGPTAEELQNAKKQIANSLDTALREPAYWWSILRNYDLRARDLNVEKNIIEDYQHYSIADIQGAFKKYYIPERHFRVSSVPVATKAAAEEKKEKKS